MSVEYRTRDGDTVDYIAWKHYGRQDGTAEAVLEANPGLAGYGPLLPAGVVLTLPDVPTPPTKATIRMWS